jgi:hypothetical protein
MARVLHLLAAGDAALAAVTVHRQVADGDQVVVALTAGAVAPSLPAGVPVHRVPDDWTYTRLLEEIFAADHVLTW